MQLQDVINRRMLELLAERKWSVNKLAERAGIAPSTLKRPLKPYATIRNTSTELINRVCVALDIPFKNFWDSSLFDHIDRGEED